MSRKTALSLTTVLGSLVSGVTSNVTNLSGYFLGNTTNSTGNSTADSIFGKYDHSDIGINTKLICAGVLGGIAFSAMVVSVKQIIKSYKKYNLAGMVTDLPTMLTLSSSALIAAGLYISDSVSNETILASALGLFTLALTLQHSSLLLKPEVDLDIIDEEKRRNSQSQSRSDVREKWNLPRSPTKKAMVSSLLVNANVDTTEINLSLQKLVKRSFVVVVLGGGTAWLSYFLTNKNSSGATITALIATSTLNLTANFIFKCKAKGGEKFVSRREVLSPTSGR